MAFIDLITAWVSKQKRVTVLLFLVFRFKWTPKPWSACSKTCSLGVMSRQFSCIQQPGNKEVTASWCSGVRQIETKTCFLKICEPTWATGNWSEVDTSPFNTNVLTPGRVYYHETKSDFNLKILNFNMGFTSY